MKLECGKKAREAAARRQTWHRWFAWHPVTVGEYDCRLFEYVWRRGRRSLGDDRCLVWVYAVELPTE